MFCLPIILSVGYVCTPGKCIDRTVQETSYPLTTCQANSKCFSYDWNGTLGHLCNTTHFEQSDAFVACKLPKRSRRGLLTIAETSRAEDKPQQYLRGWEHVVIATGAVYVVLFCVRCCQEQSRKVGAKSETSIYF